MFGCLAVYVAKKIVLPVLAIRACPKTGRTGPIKTGLKSNKHGPTRIPS